MRHRISWALSAFLVAMSLVLASCASSPSARSTKTSTTPNASAAETQGEENARDQDGVEAENRGEISDDTSEQQDGPIDLGMDDGQGSNDEPVIINRPTTATGPVALDDADTQNAAPTPHKYDRKCKTANDCSGLDEPECDGEMQCVKKQCVYMCEAQEAGDFEETETFDDAGEPLDDTDDGNSGDDL